MKKWVRILPACLVLLTCSQSCDSDVNTEGRVYLDEVLEILETNSVNRKTIDWGALKSGSYSKLPASGGIASAGPAIEFALKSLNDNHSYYIANGNGSNISSSKGCLGTYPQDVSSPTDIGYIRITGFSGFGEQAQAHAAQLQAKIAERDAGTFVGWLVDLRANSGGNMWPMIAGLGPILGEGPNSYFIDPDGNASEVSYSNGDSRLDGRALVTVVSPYSLINPNPKVAVLIDAAASSGEAVLMAFRGRPNTRLFGVTGSCGLSTAVLRFMLSDGAILGVAISTMADRNKVMFGGGVIPPDETRPTDTEAVAAAIEWLRN